MITYEAMVICDRCSKFTDKSIISGSLSQNALTARASAIEAAKALGWWIQSGVHATRTLCPVCKDAKGGKAKYEVYGQTKQTNGNN